ncbi:MAG: hypothetical protein ABIP75_16200 [Pyrinomonadaceae bacterium]
MKNESRPTHFVYLPLLLSVVFAIGCILVDPALAFSQSGSQKQQRCQQTAAQADCIEVSVSVLDPKTVGDVFGKRIGDRFVAIQVTIANHNQNFQYLIHDVSLDLSKIFISSELAPDPNLKLLTAQQVLNTLKQAEDRLHLVVIECNKRDESCRDIRDEYYENVRKREIAEQEVAKLTREMNNLEMSSLELSLMRGVAEKGQGNDPRNKVYRILRGLGTIAAGIIGITSFGSSYAPTVAVFNGPFLSAYTEALPDYTVNQMNRLSDSAYKTNTLVPRQQAKIMVAFISQPIFMGKVLRKAFNKDPSSIWHKIDFRQADAIVDGSFIEQLNNLPPLVTDVQYDATELLKFQDAEPEVKGKIVGRGLANANVKLLAPVPIGLTVEPDGAATDTELKFVVKSKRPVSPDATLNYTVSSSQGSQTISRQLGYVAKAPTLNALTPDQGDPGSEDLSVELTGTNFLPDVGVNSFRLIGDGGVSVADVAFESATKIVLTFKIRDNAKPGKRALKLIGSNGTSNSIDFTVNAPKKE